MHNVASPTVSVIINSYNYGHFVGRAIESALQQEYPEPQIEILLVDDGSTDDTLTVVRRYGRRIRIIAKANGGQASALNVGFREASGDIVCLLDADDYFYPGKLRLVTGAFQRRPDVGLVYDEFDIVGSGGISLGKEYPEPTWTGYHLSPRKVSAQLQSLILLGHPWTCITSAMSVRRALMADFEVPEDLFRLSADLFLGLVLPFRTRVTIVETPATAYVYHGENMELFRPSAENRATYQRQMAYIQAFVEERFEVHFPRYCGRSIYGPGPDRHTITKHLSESITEYRQIVTADVEPAIKRRSQAKLAASLLLPDVLYDGLRELKADYRKWRARQFRRRVAETQR